MKNFAVFIVSFIILLMTTSCKKENTTPTPQPNEKTLYQSITGKWRVDAFIIEDVEALGNLITSSTVQFNPSVSNKGYMEWKTNHSDGTDKIEEGNYTVNETTKKIDLASIKDANFIFNAAIKDSTHIDFSVLYFGERIVLRTSKF